jgi:hypothetical protein
MKQAAAGFHCHLRQADFLLDLFFYPEDGRGPPLWSSGQFLATDPEVQGSIPEAIRFSEK